MTENPPSVFVLAYDQVNSSQNETKKLFAFLRNSRLIDDWHVPFDTVILLSSRNRGSELSKMFRDFFDENQKYMLIRVERDQNFGALAPVSWDWFTNNGFTEVQVD